MDTAVSVWYSFELEVNYIFLKKELSTPLLKQKLNNYKLIINMSSTFYFNLKNKRYCP